jgi:pimeloyl-ACP methyl ester carboxylesterase
MTRTNVEPTSLHYELIQTRGLRFEVATHGAGDRLALLLHGFPESAHSYRYQVGLLTRLGYRVWAPNMRGYGKTDKPRGRRAYTLPQLAQDVTDLIDASGARSVALVGHDWGGAVAWYYAQQRARPLERLVVMNCPHPARFAEGLRSPAQLRRSSYMLFFQLPWLPEYVIRRNDYAVFDAVGRGWAVHKENIRPADVAVTRDAASQPGALTSMLHYYRAMPFSLGASSRAARGKIDVPTLLIWGERDRALGKELSRGTDRFVSNLTVHYLPDASHWVQQDDPDGVNQALESFLG